MNCGRFGIPLLIASVLLTWCSPTWASRDHDGTVWLYEADGTDLPGLGNQGDNQTVDADGTIINGWDLYTSGGGQVVGRNQRDAANMWDLNIFDDDTPMPGVFSYNLDQDTGSPKGRGGFGRDALHGKMNEDEITPNTGFTMEWRMASHFPSNDTTEKIFVQIGTGEVFDRAFEFRLNFSQEPSRPCSETEYHCGEFPDPITGLSNYNQITDVWGEKALTAKSDLRQSVWHDYRMVMDPMGLDGAGDPTEASATLYIDGDDVGQVFGRLAVEGGGGFPGSNWHKPWSDPLGPDFAPGEGPRMAFGRWSGSVYVTIIEATFDYVRIHAGATGPAVGAACDFNSNSLCDQVDIDLIAAAVRNMTSDSEFNVDGLGDPDIPDNNDFDFYITDDSMIGTGHGDADINFLVNFADFVSLSNNFGTSGTGWATGNFNTDDISNFNDFVLLSNNFGLSFASGNVPEPAAIGAMGMLTLVLLRKRH